MILRMLTAVLLACGLWAQSPPPPPVSDAQIETQVKERLAKSIIGKDGFTVRVKGGVVYWDGSTAVAQHKGAATRMAKSAGARRVVNNIRVRAGQTPPRPKGSPAPEKPKPTASLPLAPPVNAVSQPQSVQVRWVPAGH